MNEQALTTILHNLENADIICTMLQNTNSNPYTCD